MTDEEINVAIAEACGWRKEDGVYVWTANGIDWTYYELWDWANDLNAMHEAEKMLNTDELFERYYLALYDTTRSTLWPVCATAHQRAEAFLRTLGRWKEAK